MKFIPFFLLLSASTLLTAEENLCYQDMSYRQGVPFYRSSDDDTDYIITKNVRDSLTLDNTLSLNAKNVGITSVKGVVTITGTVGSYQEKQGIAMKAGAVSGVKKVVNQVVVVREK